MIGRDSVNHVVSKTMTRITVVGKPVPRDLYRVKLTNMNDINPVRTGSVSQAAMCF